MVEQRPPFQPVGPAQTPCKCILTYKKYAMRMVAKNRLLGYKLCSQPHTIIFISLVLSPGNLSTPFLWLSPKTQDGRQERVGTLYKLSALDPVFIG